jgi:hypothetical protein
VMSDILGIFALMWLTAILLTGVFGFIDGLIDSDNCDNRIHRAEYIVPGHQLGCWLGGHPDESPTERREETSECEVSQHTKEDSW